MKQKTAMKLLIEKLNRIPERQIKLYLLSVGSMYLEAEKEQMAYSWVSACQWSIDMIRDRSNEKSSEKKFNDYYNQTYLQEDES